MIHESNGLIDSQNPAWRIPCHSGSLFTNDNRTNATTVTIAMLTATKNIRNRTQRRLAISHL